MKHELLIIGISICLVLGLSFLIFNAQNYGLTGFAINNGSTENTSDSESLNENIIQEDALLALDESEQIIQEMQENNFSILYMNDTLTEAKVVFEQAKYSEILRGNVNASPAEKKEATMVLRLVNWNDINYEDVLSYTNEIKNRKEKAFLLKDKITVEESKIDEHISEQIKQILEDAKIAFYEDRYNDAENLLEEFRAAFEQEKAEASILSGIKRGAQNFFQRYWFFILIFIGLMAGGGYISYKKVEKKLLKKKIKKMKTEKKVLIDLMKKAQIQRFKQNKISAPVYDIKMKKYNEKLNTIKETLPVLESQLKKNKKKNEFQKTSNKKR